MLDHKNHNCEVFFEDGTSAKVYANWIHNNNLDLWQGWSCAAGADRILITEDLDIYSGECKNDYLGNLNSEWNLIEKPICKRARCTGCTDDLLVKKSKPND
tara:strand:+ start:502 stop:804 length:303 start_codon:yes stop_codon:yes gene_type:complete